MKNATDITIVLDRSGSMGITKTDVIGGFNSFLKEQKELSGDAKISLYTFSKKVTRDYGPVSLSEAPELTDANYVTSGWTSLYDAIGTAINDTGRRLANMAESDRPNRVLLAIITDGQENTSSEFSLSQVNSMIGHQESVYNWQIVFIGSNLEARESSESMSNLRKRNRMAPAMADGGFGSIFSNLSLGTSAFRSVDVASYESQTSGFFTPEEKVS